MPFAVFIVKANPVTGFFAVPEIWTKVGEFPNRPSADAERAYLVDVLGVDARVMARA